MFVPDENLMKSLSDLSKSSSLVQKDVVVHGKHGTFTRKQLVRVGEDNKTDKSKSSALDKFFSTKSENPKQDLSKMLMDGHKREDIMVSAKKSGISWKESDNSGINWMRASMAIQKHIKGIKQGDSPQSNTSISSYKGKSLDEMKRLFKGKTASEVQTEKSKIFSAMGKPMNGNPKRKEFEEATRPLDQLISWAINNGTGDTSKDYHTLLVTSKI